MAPSIPSLTKHRARYLIPVGAAVITAAAVFIPQAASGAQHPNLPRRTAAQLLASLEQSTPPQFSGTTVETARLGLPSLDDANLPGGITPGDGSALSQITTLLAGSHTAQLAYGGPERQRVAIFLSDLSETDVVHNGDNVWTYSSDSNSVSHQVLTPHMDHKQAPDETSPVDPTKTAEQALAKINPSTAVSVDRTAEVAGRPAYQLVLTPRDGRTLIGSIRIALDSQTSLPLRVEIWSRKSASAPAFSVGFTSISMKAPSASTFDFSVPPSAHMQSSPFGGTLGTANDQKPGPANGQHTLFSRAIGKDWTSVFVEKQSAPSTSAVRGKPAAPSLTQTLDQLATTVPAGHLITTTLATILITDDNRILVGAVTPQYLEQVAATKAAQ